jgi:poly(beta-D-mannuronate) lyase
MILITSTELAPVLATHTRVDHNHFRRALHRGQRMGNHPQRGRYTLSYSSTFSLIEHNLFTNDANDPEIVSLKSCDTLRYNTLRGSAGQFNLRSGNRDIVYGNYVLGDSVAGSLGIRVGGGGHRIFNNHVEGVSGGGTFPEGGDNTDPATLPDPCPAAVCDLRVQVNKTDVGLLAATDVGPMCP